MRKSLKRTAALSAGVAYTDDGQLELCPLPFCSILHKRDAQRCEVEEAYQKTGANSCELEGTTNPLYCYLKSGMPVEVLIPAPEWTTKYWHSLIS